MPAQTVTPGAGQHTAPNNTAQGTCIHAILIEKNGSMEELWLPTTIEGKYTFSNAEDCVSIIAENGRWKACVAQGGHFLLADPTNKALLIKKSEIPLQSNSLNVAHIGSRSFSLYLEDVCDSSKVFQPYCLGRNMDIIIGREPVCDIQYMNHLVSREHARLRYVNDRLTITDSNSKNSVYVNGRRIQSAELKMGDVIHILGLCIIVGSGYISMNNTDKCRLMSRRVAPPMRIRMSRKSFKSERMYRLYE